MSANRHRKRLKERSPGNVAEDQMRNGQERRLNESTRGDRAPDYFYTACSIRTYSFISFLFTNRVPPCIQEQIMTSGCPVHGTSVWL